MLNVGQKRRWNDDLGTVDTVVKIVENQCSLKDEYGELRWYLIEDVLQDTENINITEQAKEEIENILAKYDMQLSVEASCRCSYCIDIISNTNGDIANIVDWTES